MDPSLFYTGLVADLYAPLRSESPDPEPYARFIARSGEPALELACGDGDPILELRRRGSRHRGARLLARHAGAMPPRRGGAGHRRGAPRAGDGVDGADPPVPLDLPRRRLVQPPPRRRRGRSLRSNGSATHLVEGGSALIPLHIPAATPEHSRWVGPRVRPVPTVRCCASPRSRRNTTTSVARRRRSPATRSSRTERPKYSNDRGSSTGTPRPTSVSSRPSAGLQTNAVLDATGRPATESADTFVFWLVRDP